MKGPRKCWGPGLFSARVLAGECLFSNPLRSVFHPVRVGEFEFGQRIHELLQSYASLVGFGHDLDDAGASVRTFSTQSFSPRAGAGLAVVLVIEMVLSLFGLAISGSRRNWFSFQYDCLRRLAVVLAE